MSDFIYEEIVRGWPTADLAKFTRENFRHLAETGSTNDDLLGRARAGMARPFDLLAADFQTKGRGRRGDRWEAVSGRNLLFSLALPLEVDRETWSRLPHLSASVVGAAIEAILGSGHRLQAKWPNDLFIKERKLAGILVEIALMPRPFAVVGVGINVNLRRDEFPPELRETATSLYEILECESSRWFLLGLITRGFIDQFPDSMRSFDTVLDWIGERDFLLGKTVRIRSGSRWLEGTAAGIGSEGELLLEAAGGSREKIVSAEEIRWK